MTAAEPHADAPKREERAAAWGSPIVTLGRGPLLSRRVGAGTIVDSSASSSAYEFAARGGRTRQTQTAVLVGTAVCEMMSFRARTRSSQANRMPTASISLHHGAAL